MHWRTAIAAIAAGLVVAVGAASGAANLLKNGGFEQPVVPVGGFEFFATGATFAHWTVVGAPGNVAIFSGSYTENGFSFPAKSGAQWLDLTGNSNAAAGVSQTLPTTSGTQYKLAFSVGNVVD